MLVRFFLPLRWSLCLSAQCSLWSSQQEGLLLPFMVLTSASSSQRSFSAPALGFLPSCSTTIPGSTSRLSFNCCVSLVSRVCCVNAAGSGDSGSQSSAGITLINVIRSCNTDKLRRQPVQGLSCSWICSESFPHAALTTCSGRSRSPAGMSVLPQNLGSESHHSPVLFFFAFCRPWPKRSKQHPEGGGSLEPGRIDSNGQQRMLL